MQDSVVEADLPTAGKEYHLLPRVDYKYDALNRVRQSHPVNVTFAVQIDGKDAGQQFVTARVHPINDCPYAYQNSDDERITWTSRGCSRPTSTRTTRRSRGCSRKRRPPGVVDGFDAYQSKDEGTVLLQVFAVWEALRQHDIKYSDIGTTTSESDSLYSLHVRFMDEVLSESHANCVDASALLASVLRRMGIDTFLVMEPGHMYLGIYLDADGKQSACLETTMLGDPDPAKGRGKPRPGAFRDEGGPGAQGLEGFNDALDSATREFKKHKRHFEKGDDPEYEVVDISAARREGIAPIGYVKPE